VPAALAFAGSAEVLCTWRCGVPVARGLPAGSAPDPLPAAARCNGGRRGRAPGFRVAGGHAPAGFAPAAAGAAAAAGLGLRPGGGLRGSEARLAAPSPGWLALRAAAGDGERVGLGA
jgi:hypothetical protein